MTIIKLMTIDNNKINKVIADVICRK